VCGGEFSICKMGCAHSQQHQTRLESVHELAFRGDHLAIAKRMAASPDCVSEAEFLHKKTPLHVSTSEGHVEVVRLLVSSRYVELRARDDEGRTALYIAAEKGHVEILNMLMPPQEEILVPLVNTPTNRGLTALMIATIHNSIEIFKILVKAGADVSIKDYDGNSCLHHAVLNDSTKCAWPLIARGIDINGINNLGETPLFIAVIRGHVSSCELLLMQDTVLLETPPSSSGISYGNSSTLLHIAVAQKNLHVVELLVNKMVSMSKSLLDEQDIDGNSALHYACAYGTVSIVRFLVQAGADPYLFNNKREVPLTMSGSWCDMTSQAQLAAQVLEIRSIIESQ